MAGSMRMRIFSLRVEGRGAKSDPLMVCLLPSAQFNRPRTCHPFQLRRGGSGLTQICYCAYVTDRQRGWNCALNLIDDVVMEAACQPVLQSNCRKAALVLTKIPVTMMGMVGPLRKRLEGESCPEPPFDSALPEDCPSDMDTAISILTDALRCLVCGADPANWTWSEIAENLKSRVAYEQRNESQAFKQATADLVRPIYRLLSQNHTA